MTVIDRARKAPIGVPMSLHPYYRVFVPYERRQVV